MSTVSAKVPLRFVGAGQELDGSGVAAGGVSPLERLLQVALAGKATAPAAPAAAAAESGAAVALEQQAAAAAGLAGGDGSMVVMQEAAAVDWMHTPDEQQHRAVRQRAGRPGGYTQRLCLVRSSSCWHICLEALPLPKATLDFSSVPV
jgi:hypothetical protein